MGINIVFIAAVCIILIDNCILSKLFKLNPLFDIIKGPGYAAGTGIALTFIMGIISFITFIFYEYLFFLPYNIFLRIIFLASLVILIERLINIIIIRFFTAHDDTISAFLLHLSINSIMLCLFISVSNIESGFNVARTGLQKTLIRGFGSGICFTVVLMLMTGIRERLELAEIPAYIKGLPVSFITACLLALAFLGFSGIKI